MLSLCTVCHKSKVLNYFLIKCISCAKFWHHRCHSPPIPDPELIAIIKAFNDARARNSDATLNWKCAACRKVKPNQVDPAPKPRTINTKDNPFVVDDDGDEVEIIQSPVKRQESSKPHSKKSTSARVAQPVQIIDDPIDFLVSPPAAQPPSHVQHSTSAGHLSVSENQQGIHHKYDVIPVPTPPVSTDLELHSQRASTPSHPYKNLHSQLKTSGNQQTALPSSRARSRSAQRGSADQPSSPPTAPSLGPLEASRINPSTKERPFLERWSMATIQLPRSDHPPSSRDPAPSFHPALLPHYINAQYRNSTSESESDKRIDVWYLASLGNSKVKDAGPGHAQSTEPKAASDPSHRRRNRKGRVVHHEANNEKNRNVQSVSKVPFYFSVNTWMKQNKDALTSFEAIV